MSREGGSSMTAPSRVTTWSLLLLSLLGLATAFELTRIHLWVHTAPDYRSFCAISETVNCDTVAESPYSVFLGVPVAAWGMLGYGIMAALAGLLVRRPSGGMAGLLSAFVWFSVGTSLVLGTISVFAIESICILCFTTYAINLLMAGILLYWSRGKVLAALAEGFHHVARHRARYLPAGLAVVLLAGGAMAVYPPYWKVQVLRGPGGLATGTDPEGHPWIGATSPKLVIQEFSDYQCPHCRRGHKEVRALVEAHPDAIRFIHRHFPLDEQCNPLVKRRFHPQACKLARMVVCAGRQGKTWEANDLIFFQTKNVRTLGPEVMVSRLGLDQARFSACMKDPSSLGPVKRDIDEGLSLGIRGTPTYVIDGKTYPGHIPDSVLVEVLGERR